MNQEIAAENTTFSAKYEKIKNIVDNIMLLLISLKIMIIIYFNPKIECRSSEMSKRLSQTMIYGKDSRAIVLIYVMSENAGSSPHCLAKNAMKLNEKRKYRKDINTFSLKDSHKNKDEYRLNI